MMHRVIRGLCAATAFMALTGCGGDGDKAEKNGGAPNAVAVAPVPTAEGTPRPEPGMAVPEEPMEGGAELTVARSLGYGGFLADKTGRPLYLFTADSLGRSNCYGGCAETWPPLLESQGTPTPGSARVQATLLATIRRRDGAAQVTYNGHPLYYYVKDVGTDRPQGHNVHDSGGEWYLVTPRGEKVEDYRR